MMASLPGGMRGVPVFDVIAVMAIAIVAVLTSLVLFEPGLPYVIHARLPEPDSREFPGLLSALAVEEGQEVKAGEALAIVEAMKMENVLRAERDGTIAKLRAQPGDSLAVDQVILEFA